MRTIGFRSNVLFIIAASVGLLASLGRPWYAKAPVLTPEEVRIGDVQGPVEQFFSASRVSSRRRTGRRAGMGSPARTRSSPCSS